MLRLLLLIALVLGKGARADEARLDLRAPRASETVRGRLPLVEVAGRISRAQPLDLVIALDVSESSLLPAGSDVDGDGMQGRIRSRRIHRSDGSLRPVSAWNTDPGDSVLEASRASARRLLAALPADRARVGLLSFAEHARIRARLGPAQRVQEALESIRPPSGPVATDLERAIRAGHRLLGAHDEDGTRKVLILLSDGCATRPGPPKVAAAAARRAALHAARFGISIHPAALACDRLAAPTDLEQVLDQLRATVPLVHVDVANLTTGEPGRALRLWASGSFDAFVRLTKGRNRIRVRARALGGPRLAAYRTVYFDPPPGATAGDRALARSLKVRALEIELAGVAAGAKRARRRLEIEPEH